MKVFKFNYKHIFVACAVFLALALYASFHMGKSLSQVDSVYKGKRLLARERLVFTGRDQSQVDSAEKDIPIVIVEEHHEVLQHWFSGVKDGVISRHGNFLIHIDGHSDGAPPIMLDPYPESLYPSTRQELTAMIQRNDAFILAAALSGFISHSMWIWPAWDAENHDEPLEMELMLLGVTDVVYHNMENVKIRSGCVCESDDNGKPVLCNFMNITSSTERNGTRVDPKLCDIKARLYQYIIREDVALEMARNGSLFQLEGMTGVDKGRVLLDIDEDFYGCESAVQPALDEKLTMGIINRISLYANLLFCPLNTVMESLVDRFLGDFLGSLLRAKQCHTNGRDCKNAEVDMMKFDKAIAEGRVLRGALRSRSSTLRQRTWKTLRKLFDNLTVPQIVQLKELGICFQTTPKSFDFEPGEAEHIRVCHGANTPNMSVVNYHTPTETENLQRTELLQALLSATRKSSIEPSMVTVCRSMRDGYTPRKYFKDIERDVLSSIKDVFHSRNVHYDRDLMGGEHGWPGRHGG